MSVTSGSPRAIAVGALCATRIFQVETVPSLPAKVMARRLVEVVDGMALSAACAFARLGGRAGIWARCGDDEPGRAARAVLQAERHLAGHRDRRRARRAPGRALSRPGRGRVS
jgi:sugar/nucleoside kinase (ribokinase family)